MFHGRSVFAIVPARCGSKGIARKNLRELAGLSLIAHAAAFVASLPWLDAAVISTDDPIMAEEAERHGLAAPFLRPTELAGDRAEAIGVWRHAWLDCEARSGRSLELGLYLEPTSPMRTPDDVERCLAAIVQGEFETAATVSPTPSSFSFEKSLRIEDDGRLAFVAPPEIRVNRRQLVAQTWHRNGLCYAAGRAAVVERGEIIGDRCAAVPVERRVVNIDEPFDLRIGELLMSDLTNGAAATEA